MVYVFPFFNFKHFELCGSINDVFKLIFY